MSSQAERLKKRNNLIRSKYHYIRNQLVEGTKVPLYTRKTALAMMTNEEVCFGLSKATIEKIVYYQSKY